MLKTGLTSVTFRNKTPEEIIGLAKDAGLEAIEWGGDIHVPHGDTAAAERIGEMTRKQGMLAESYGSYYRCAEEELPFQTILDTAKALGCSVIRVWAGREDGRTAGEEEYQKTARTLSRAVELAGKAGIEVACEFHGGTLNDSLEDSKKLLSMAEGLKSYWQPLFSRSAEEELEILTMLGDRLANVHTYCGIGPSQEALVRGEAGWTEYIRYLREYVEKSGRIISMLLEFVKGGRTAQFFEDARCLKQWLG